MAITSNCTASIIKDAALALKEGHLVAFPTETVYGLGADATNEKAVARIYEVKGRPKDHPLIVHISSMELLNKWASEIPDYALKLARAFWPGPMTLVLKRTELAKDFITGGQDTVAIRVPAHALAGQLLQEFESLGGNGIAAPSANRFGKVSPTTADAVTVELNKFLSKNDQILEGGDSEIGLESSIIDCTKVGPRILRPGFITSEMIEPLLEVELIHIHSIRNDIKVPGLLDSHYSPNTRVIINGIPKTGDGFVALSSIPTPKGAVRIASPENNSEFARILYKSFRIADSLSINNLIVIPPKLSGVGVAINDRLIKAQFKENIQRE